MYGPDPAVVAAVRSWLSSEGFHVDLVAPSRLFLHVSGSAQAAETAFHTTLHLYRIGGSGDSKVYRGTSTEPSVPPALAPYIAVVQGLSELPIDPPRSTTLSASNGVQPALTSGSGTTHFVAPSDFAAIYDLNPLYNSGVNGAGYKVAVIGRSQVNPNDVSTFEAIFGLPATAVNAIVPPLGADPGQTNTSDQGEASLDVERVLGTAPGAQPDLIVSSDASGGLDTAIGYNVQTLEAVMAFAPE